MQRSKGNSVAFLKATHTPRVFSEGTFAASFSLPPGRTRSDSAVTPPQIISSPRKLPPGTCGAGGRGWGCHRRHWALTSSTLAVTGSGPCPREWQSPGTDSQDWASSHGKGHPSTLRPTNSGAVSPNTLLFLPWVPHLHEKGHAHVLRTAWKRGEMPSALPLFCLLVLGVHPLGLPPSILHYPSSFPHLTSPDLGSFYMATGEACLKHSVSGTLSLTNLLWLPLPTKSSSHSSVLRDLAPPLPQGLRHFAWTSALMLC